MPNVRALLGTPAGHLAAGAFVLVGSVTLARAARADVFLPPIPGVDFLYLGSPIGPLVGLAVVAATVGLFIALQRRKVHGCLAVVAAAVLFLAGDCTAYLVGLDRAGRARRERRRQREEEAPRPPVPASASVAPEASSPAPRRP